MSFARQVYIAAILAGWAALVGWVACEFVILPLSAGAAWEAIPSAGIVGAAIGVGVGAAAGLAGGGWKQTSSRAGAGLIGGLLGGLLGGLIGQGLYRLGLPQWLGWTVIGVGIGGTDGLFSRDSRRLRNGLIGGLLGGLVGGLVFRGLGAMFTGGTGMTARAVGFVAIGVAIGTMVGLVQVLLRNAWLTVVDGNGPGRQLILAGVSTPLGTSPEAGLVIADAGVAEYHAALVPTSSGYEVEDRGSALGTAVNGRLVAGRSRLVNGDVIRIGSTYLRFNTATHADTDEDEPVPASQLSSPPMREQPIPPATRSSVAAPPPPAAPKLKVVPPAAVPRSPPNPMPLKPAAAPAKVPAKALHKCPECGEGVEKPAGVCPHCGAMY